MVMQVDMLLLMFLFSRHPKQNLFKASCVYVKETPSMLTMVMQMDVLLSSKT